MRRLPLLFYALCDVPSILSQKVRFEGMLMVAKEYTNH